MATNGNGNGARRPRLVTSYDMPLEYERIERLPRQPHFGVDVLWPVFLTWVLAVSGLYALLAAIPQAIGWGGAAGLVVLLWRIYVFDELSSWVDTEERRWQRIQETAPATSSPLQQTDQSQYRLARYGSFNDLTPGDWRRLARAVLKADSVGRPALSKAKVWKNLTGPGDSLPYRYDEIQADFEWMKWSSDGRPTDLFRAHVAQHLPPAPE